MEYVLLEMDDDANLTELVGMVFNDIVMTDDLINDKIRPALDAFKEICGKYPGELDYMVEVKGSLDSVIPGAFGTVDILGKFTNGPLLVLDWKFGDGIPVKVNGNMQLGFYAGGAIYSDDKDVKELIGAEQALDIVFAIVQPRRGHDDEPNYQLWETDDEWVEDFIDTAYAAYQKAISDNPPIKAGSHCRWCRAQPNCPEKTKVIGQAQSMPIAESMDTIALSKAITIADDLEDWIKAVRARAHAELERGVKIPGFKLVPKRGTRIYNDVEKARGVLVRQLKTEAAHKPREIITPAQAEKKLGKEKYSKLLSKYVTMHSSGNTMASDDDPRPDVGDTLTQLGGGKQKTKSSLFDK
jgi:hypothetical protein